MPRSADTGGRAAARAATGAEAARTDAERDAVLGALRPVVDGLAATLGSSCEAVLHDFRRPENSVTAIAGSLTGRGVGGAMSEIGLGLLAAGDDAEDRLNYVTRDASGRLLKSSTMVLRDSAGGVFGALCVNLDITAVRRARDVLDELAGLAPEPAADAPAPPTTTFGQDVDEVVDAAVDAVELSGARTWAELDRPHRLAFFRELDARGVFAVRRAVPRVAARLGISRAGAYGYLADSRKTPPGPPRQHRTASEGAP